MEDSKAARYRPGDRVKVRPDTPSGHHRTPGYVKDKPGRVKAYCGDFRNPESLAYGGSGLPKQPLYRVEFEQCEVWTDYSGHRKDKVYVDIYEDWLDPA